MVRDGLSMHGDAVEASAEPFGEREGGRRVLVPDRRMEPGQVAGAHRRTRCRRERAVLDQRWVRASDVRDEARPASVERDRRRVDAVRGRTGHEARRDHAAAASWTAMRKRYMASSFVRPKYTRFVRRITVRSR